MLYLQLGGRGGPVGKMFQPRASEGWSSAWTDTWAGFQHNLITLNFEMHMELISL